MQHTHTHMREPWLQGRGTGRRRHVFAALQLAANTVAHTATQCATLQNALHVTAPHYNTQQRTLQHSDAGRRCVFAELQLTASQCTTHCNTT